MDEERNLMAERILDLTLEIIYLVTGEEIPSVKSGGLVTIKLPPPLSLKIGSNKIKILEVAKKITDLLMGEEWEYLEGHKELYKDVMMASQPALTSPDGSSNRNPPERCPGPLYSQESTQIGFTIPHHHQSEDLIPIKVEIKEEEEEVCVMGDRQATQEVEMTIKYKLEESSVDIGSDGQYFGNNSERPLESGDDHVDDDDITQCSPSLTRGDIIIHRAFGLGTSMDRTDPEESSDRSHVVCQGAESSTDSSNLREEDERPFSCSDCGKRFGKKYVLLLHQTIHTGERPFSCSVCEKSFAQKGTLLRHQKIHTGERPYSCSECGKCFSAKHNLSKHQSFHTGDYLFSCSECGKGFTQKAELLRHQRTHTGERPFSCLECGKRFTDKRNLFRHQGIHTGLHSYACSECGKCFTQKANLLRHQRIHTGERPFSCTECGKCFTDKWDLTKHLKRTHVKKPPFACSSGETFSKEAQVVTHQTVHELKEEVSPSYKN